MFAVFSINISYLRMYIEVSCFLLAFLIEFEIEIYQQNISDMISLRKAPNE